MPSQGTTKQRGYNYRHKQLREKVKPIVDAGRAICWRCGEKIAPGQPWDLGHDDDNRAIYKGPEHRGRECKAGGNRATAGRRSGTAEATSAPLVDTSRRW